MSDGAFQSDAFYNNAFQVHVEEVCTPAFDSTAFDNDGFQVCVDEAATGGGWVELPETRRARRQYERKRREAWRKLEDAIEEAYAKATGQTRKEVRPVVQEALAQREPARVEAIAAQLATSGDPQAERLVAAIQQRLTELEAAALVYERMQEQARILWRQQEEDAIAILLLAS